MNTPVSLNITKAKSKNYSDIPEDPFINPSTSQANFNLLLFSDITLAIILIKGPEVLR